MTLTPPISLLRPQHGAGVEMPKPSRPTHPRRIRTKTPLVRIRNAMQALHGLTIKLSDDDTPGMERLASLLESAAAGAEKLQTGRSAVG